ncbi:MAG: hypothetical protein HY869_21050 [Chloroflexi bacterium]|nr:hypothetical protein [Chloroflexota bacterium]
MNKNGKFGKVLSALRYVGLAILGITLVFLAMAWSMYVNGCLPGVTCVQIVP